MACLLLRCVSQHPAAASLEEWISTKDFPGNNLEIGPKWHIPCNEEIQFANELLKLHFEGALDDLQKICQSKIHSDPGAAIHKFLTHIFICVRNCLCCPYQYMGNVFEIRKVPHSLWLHVY